jgi:hypothetical protein
LPLESRVRLTASQNGEMLVDFMFEDPEAGCLALFRRVIADTVCEWWLREAQ